MLSQNDLENLSRSNYCLKSCLFKGMDIRFYAYSDIFPF